MSSFTRFALPATIMSAVNAYRILTPGEVAAAAVVLPVIDAILVGLRFYSRHKRNVGYRVEDWLVAPALVRSVLLLSASGRQTS